MPDKIVIYVPDDTGYKHLHKKVQSLWYDAFGASLTQGEIILKALHLLEAELSKDRVENDNQGQTLYKYGRIGS